MSSFICPECNALISDSPLGYITGCEHYPIEQEGGQVNGNAEQRNQ